jgi:hypothetical protein
MKYHNVCSVILLLLLSVSVVKGQEKKNVTQDSDIHEKIDALNSKIDSLHPKNSSTTNNIILLSLDENDGGLKISRDYNQIKRGEFFRIKIENINTYLYKVALTNTDVATEVKLPSSPLTSLNFSGLTSLAANLNSVSNIVSTLPKSDSLISQVESYKMLQTLNMGEGVYNDTLTLDEILITLNQTSKAELQEIRNLRTNINDLFFNIQGDHNSILTNRKNQLSKVPEIDTIQKNLKEFEKYRNEIVEIRDRLMIHEAGLKSVSTVYAKEIKDNKEHNSLIEKLKKINEEYTAILDKMETSLSVENYTTTSTMYADILNNVSFSYLSLPIQHYDDLNEITVTVTPRDDKAKLGSYATKLRVPDYEKTFWGVSTGFYVACNPEENYSVRERMIDGAVVYDLIEEEQSDVEMGISTMVHYGFNISKKKYGNFFLQGGFGAGLTINEKVKPRLMFGVGPAYGRKNKVFLNAGMIYMFFDSLSKVYNTEGNLTQPQNFLVGATKLDLFVSLGYLIKLD